MRRGEKAAVRAGTIILRTIERVNPHYQSYELWLAGCGSAPENLLTAKKAGKN
jgi:hypothetical protein